MYVKRSYYYNKYKLVDERYLARPGVRILTQWFNSLKVKTALKQ